VDAEKAASAHRSNSWHARAGKQAMKRAEIRELKRAVTREKDGEAMLQLLRRSVRFGHRKLALLRCLQAESLGIQIAPDLLAYCQQVAESLPESVLHRVIAQSVATSANCR
jgi:hypothetical protein